MSKRCGLSRKFSGKNAKLSNSQFVPPSQSRSTPSPPLIDDDEILSSSISFKEPQFNSTRISEIRPASQLQSKSTSQKSTQPATSCEFQQILEKNGISFSPDEATHTSRIKAKELISKIKSYFKNHVDFPENVDDFLASFKKYISDKNNFKKLLTGSILLPEINSPILEHVQMSVLQMLLRIDFMQTKLIDILIDEMTNYIFKDDMPDEMFWIRSILGQLRDLESFEDEDNLLKQLFAVIESSSHKELAQHELIWSLPNITPDSLHNTVALELSRILKDNFALTSVILDNLGCLWVTPNVRAQLDNQVLELLKIEAPLDKMHNFTKYLMWRCNANNAQVIIEGLRKNLDWGSLMVSMDDRYKADRYTSQMVTFSTIRDSLSRTFLSEIWSKLLFSFQSHKDILPFDVIIIFMLCEIPYKHKQNYFTTTSKRIIDRILRRKVLEKAFKDYFPVFKDNFRMFRELFTKFLKSKHSKVSEYGGYCFKCYIFFQEESDKKPIYSSHITKTVIIDLVQLIQYNATTRTTIINVLSDLCKSHVSILCHNAVLLNKLLYSIDLMPLAEVRMAMDILCSAAYPQNNQNTGFSLQDDIRIYIPKCLSSYITIEKKKGIICCVTLVKHLGKQSVTKSSSTAACSSSAESILNLSEELGKEASNLIDSMLEYTLGESILVGMAYEELSIMLSLHKSELSNKITSWLCHKITSDFKRCFTTEDIESELNGCSLKEMFCINEQNENSIRVYINIAPVEFKGSRDYCITNIAILPPLFRLLRILQDSYGADLPNINAILGYAVIMPEIDDDDEFLELSFDQRNFVLNCIFHCINWFRELINAHIEVPQMEIKVISRLKTVVKLEKQFYKLLSLHGLDYAPPMSDFYLENPVEVSLVAKSTKKGHSKKDKSKELMNTEATMQENTTNLKTQVNDSKSNINNSVEDQNGRIFRTYEDNFITLLRKKLSLDSEGTITMNEMIYILQNVLNKLDCLKEKSKTPKEKIFIQEPDIIIKHLLLVLPDVLENFYIICQLITDTLKECDNIKDASVMFFEKSVQAKMCLSLFLKLFSQLFDWTGFTNSTNKKLFQELLGTFIKSNDTSKNIEDLVEAVAEFFLKYKTIIVILPCAALLIKILNTLLKYIDKESLDIKLITLAHEFLSEEWYDETGVAEKGKQCNINLEILLKNYFYKADIKKIVQNVNWIKEEVSGSNKKNFRLNTFPNFHKSNFALLYRNLFSAFNQAVEDRILKPLSCTQHLRFWEAIMNTLGKLMYFAKELDIKIIVNIFIKQSSLILKVFLKQGLPGLEASLKTNTEEVTNILKTMQQSTRFINSICVQAKTTKDVALMANVPKVLKILESIVFQVKAVLVANKCSTAFIMGNLINRNVKGDIIATQSTNVTESNNSENELPSDDTESELDSDPEQEEKEKNSESRSNFY